MLHLFPHFSRLFLFSLTILSCLSSPVVAIQTQEVELGTNGTYDGLVRIKRDSTGTLLFQDSQNTSPVRLSDMLHGAASTTGTVGLTTVTLVERALESDVCTTATRAILAATAQYATTATRALSADVATTCPLALTTVSLSTVGVSKLQDLSDVVLSSQTAGQGLGWNGSKWSNMTFSADNASSAGLPEQSGNAGKYLTTDGSALSWNSVDSVGSSSTCYYTSGTLSSGSSVTVTHAADSGPGFKRSPHFFAGVPSADTLLMHFDNTVSDAAGKICTNNSATTSSLCSKFGGGSGYFSGSAYCCFPVANYLGSSNWTIDFWVYMPNSTYGDMKIVNGGDSSDFFIGFNGSSFGFGRNGVAWDYTVTHGISNNTWAHVALVKSGATYSVFINGALKGATTNSNTYKISGLLYVGANAGSTAYYGYMDELRITCSSKWTSAFSVPTSAYALNKSNIWTPVQSLYSTTSSTNTYVQITYADANGENQSTNTTFTNNTGGCMDYLATVQVLP